MIRLVISVFVVIGAVLAKHEDYEGFAVYEVRVENEAQINVLNQLEDEYNLDVWSHALPSRPGNILIPKNKKQEISEKLFYAGIPYVIKTDNVKELLDLEDSILQKASRRSRNNESIGLPFDTIHRYDVVDRYLVELGEKFPEVVTVVSAGKSFEGRDIKYLRISTTNFKDSSKPVIFLETLIHAREWITLPATLYAIEELVINVTEKDLVEDIDWVILPIANPDGYEWSHTNTRFWRKNRATNYTVGDICMGVDLNRNFDVFWSHHSSNNVCSETFHGRGPLSEPEAEIIGSIMKEHSERLAMFADIHSFGSMILYGYGNGDFPSNVLQLHVGGVQMAQAIDAVKWPTNINYIVGNLVNVLYLASGTAQDYGQITGRPGVLSYTFELPGFNNTSGLNGFLVDPDFIEQAGFETWEGLKVGARYALTQFRQSKQQRELK